MSKELVLADKIMKEANKTTGWKFCIMARGEGYEVGTSLLKKDGQAIEAIFEVQKSEVVIKTILPECRFSEEKVKQVLEEIDFPIMAMGNSGEVLLVKCPISFEFAKMSTDIIVRDIMQTMIAAMLEIA